MPFDIFIVLTDYWLHYQYHNNTWKCNQMDFNKQFDTLDFSDDQPQTTPCFHNWSTFDVKSLISVATCGYFVPKFRHSFFSTPSFLARVFRRSYGVRASERNPIWRNQSHAILEGVLLIATR